jgi:large subunit ribosomal protein L21
VDKNKTFSVIKISGQQYTVSEGDTIKVDRINDSSSLDVLLVNDGNEVFIGTPTLSDWGIELSVIENKKDKKVHVRKFKAKSRYRRNVGHRQSISMLKVVKISKGKSKINMLEESNSIVTNDTHTNDNNNKAMVSDKEKKVTKTTKTTRADKTDMTDKKSKEKEKSEKQVKKEKVK